LNSQTAEQEPLENLPITFLIPGQELLPGEEPTPKKYVKKALRHPKIKLAAFLAKGNLVPDPRDILGDDATEEQIKLYEQTRVLSDRLVTDLLDSASRA
jgi:hypothetical protein